MKRLICMILGACLLLSGCSMIGERIKEPVTFYYVREDYRKEMEQVIVSEVREASGHRDDLSYLLALYSMGPSKEDLRSPLPRNTTIVPTEHSGDTLVLNLSENVVTMSEANFTLAGACIALTCMELTDVNRVTIVCEDRNITIEKDDLLLNSNFVQKTQEETK